jgi:membrane protein YqaA with SNARE-associated domain
MSEGVRIQQRNVGSSLRHSLSPRGRQRQSEYLALATLGCKQPSVAVFVIAFLGRLLGHASGYEIGFRGGRPLLERGWKNPEAQIETIYRGEKLLERCAWRGA